MSLIFEMGFRNCQHKTNKELWRYSGVNVVCMRKKGNAGMLEIMEVQVEIYGVQCEAIACY